MSDQDPAVEFALHQGDRCRNYGPEHERTKNENCIVTLADEILRLRDITNPGMAAAYEEGMAALQEKNRRLRGILDRLVCYDTSTEIGQIITGKAAVDAARDYILEKLKIVELDQNSDCVHPDGIAVGTNQEWCDICGAMRTLPDPSLDYPGSDWTLPKIHL